MNKENLIADIIAAEWPMFHNVNGETRTGCQNEYDTFFGMRNAQFSAWDEDSLQSYLSDLHDAEKAGRNLAREKYIIMMRSTDPAGYAYFIKEVPELSDRKKQLVEDIWAILLEQTIVIRMHFPMVALGGRPLLMAEEQGWPSVENYQTAELLTYSEATLEKLLAHIRREAENGVSFAAIVSENSVLAAGYCSMEDAERIMRLQQSMRNEPGAESCSCRGE